MSLSIHALKESFIRLGSLFQSLKGENDFEQLLAKVQAKNPWFTQDNILAAFSAWSDALSNEQMNQWLLPYESQLKNNQPPKTIGVINAGNIPLVGFHDFLCVLMSGNNYLGKNSSDDPYLLPFVAEKLVQVEPKLKERISFTEKLSGFDAVIATGSDNTSRYFEYYFGKYPNIIRMNRNAVAVLTSEENSDDLKNLGNDIFQYFGMGCRNVSKIFIPKNYDLKNFFEGIESFSTVSQHHKYMNNHDYNNAVYLLKKIPFLDNGFLLLKEDEVIASPVSVLYYEFYDDMKSLTQKLETKKEKIQCIVGRNYIPFGKAQQPQLWEYADGVDTMKFLLTKDHRP
jgi:hypothetical protein